MPMLEDIRVPLGMCYFQIEKFDQAIELFEGIDIEFLTENVLNNLGAVCIQSQVYELAEKYLLAAEEKPGKSGFAKKSRTSLSKNRPT